VFVFNTLFDFKSQTYLIPFSNIIFIGQRLKKQYLHFKSQSLVLALSYQDSR
jgi:hypothetical protein